MQLSLFSIRYIYNSNITRCFIFIFMDIHNHFIMRWGGSEQVKYIVNLIKGQELLKVKISTGKAKPVEITFSLFLLYTGDSTILEK